MFAGVLNTPSCRPVGWFNMIVVTIAILTFYSFNDFLMFLNVLDTSFWMLTNVSYSEDVIWSDNEILEL